jgi:hypothetical protein
VQLNLSQKQIEECVELIAKAENEEKAKEVIK